MAENYISQFYTWATGNTITAARLNGNVSNLTDGLSGGAKAINVGKVLMGGFEALDSSRNASLASITLTGDITTTGAAIDWDLIDNNASALSIDAVGKTGLLNIDTTDGSEGISMSGFLTVTDVVTANSVVVDNITINTNDISSTSGNLTLTPVAGSAVVIDGAASFDAGVVTGITSLTTEAIVSVTGNLTLTPVAGSAVVIDTAVSIDGGLVTGITSLAVSGGSAASPSIYFTGDTNTGIFAPAADTIGLSTGGTERLRIDSSGNVGIANSSPGAPLDIVGRVFIDSDGNGLSGDGFLAIGEAGVGTGAAITLGSDTTSFSQIAFSDGDTGNARLSGLIKYTHSSDTLEIWAGQTARMQIVTGVQIGSPTGGDKGAGTINAAGDIYKNNSAYTNPDYVFERYFKGKIEKFIENEGAKEYLGLTCITKLEEKMKNTLRLPGMDGDSKGIFGRADFVLEKLEEAYLYIIQLHNRLSILEEKS